jgi:parallel beta-helix repeat protein
MRIILLIVALLVALAATGSKAIAQTSPEPCPVVADNITLSTDCLAPMIVAGDNLTINLGTHQVLCPANPGQTNFFVDGIVVESRSNVHITNGHVHQCRYGIEARGGGSHALTNLHLETNYVGIHLDGSADNRMAESDLAANYYGVRMENGATGNELHAGIVLQSNSIAGVEMMNGSNDNVVTSSTILGPNNVSIQIVGSHRNTIQSSLLDGQNGCQAGINLVASSQTLIQANRITGCNEGGIIINQFSSLTEIVTNRVYGNPGSGILGAEGSSTTFAHNNQVLGNNFGIVLRPTSTKNTIDSNTARDNTGFDLRDDNPNCDANVWTNNNSGTQNQPCID